VLAENDPPLQIYSQKAEKPKTNQKEEKSLDLGWKRGGEENLTRPKRRREITRPWLEEKGGKEENLTRRNREENLTRRNREETQGFLVGRETREREYVL
jgi:hypothetical protein